MGPTLWWLQLLCSSAHVLGGASCSPRSRGLAQTLVGSYNSPLQRRLPFHQFSLNLPVVSLGDLGVLAVSYCLPSLVVSQCLGD